MVRTIVIITNKWYYPWGMKISKYLNPKYKEEILVDLCRTIASIKNANEAAELIKDIFTENESEVIAKRVEIARLLLKNQTFDQISEKLKTSKGTISRVALWLREGGQGLRKSIERTNKKPKERVERENWSGLKRRYSKYYWPEIILEEIIASANRKRKEKLLKTLNKIKTKTVLYKRLSEILKENYSHPSPKI